MPPKRFANSDEVVAAAAELFQRQGYQNTTIENIAGHLGIAKPTVYQYVNGKGSLLEQIVGEVLERLAEEHRQAMESSDDPEQQLRRLVRGYVRTVAEMRTHYRIFLGEEKELPPRTRRRFAAASREMADEFAALLERCADAGVIRADVDPQIASFLIIGALVSASRWYDPTGELDPDAFADEAMALVEGYMALEARGTARAGAD
jgi:AcrR family transcriptional regulator